MHLYLFLGETASKGHMAGLAVGPAGASVQGLQLNSGLQQVVAAQQAQQQSIPACTDHLQDNASWARAV